MNDTLIQIAGFILYTGCFLWGLNFVQKTFDTTGNEPERKPEDPGTGGFI